MKPRSIALTALGVVLSMIAAIAAVLNSSPSESNQTPDPAQKDFNQPSIGKEPSAYGPLFKPNNKPCDGPNCPN